MLFSQVIGQSHVKAQLLTALKAGRISHAQLFTGKTGYGTMALALAFANYIMCNSTKTDDACGDCASCKQNNGYSHPDLHFVFPVFKGTRRTPPISYDFLPQWREMLTETSGYFNLTTWMQQINVGNSQVTIYMPESDEIMRIMNLKSYESDYKILIFWLPEKMPQDIANKLLKIVEEPYEKSLFIFVSESPDSVISTILSRTQRVTIPPILDKDMSEYLVKRYGISQTEADDVAHLAGGDLCVANQYMENQQVSPYLDTFIKLMQLCWRRKMPTLNEWVEEISGIGRESQKEFLTYSMHLIRESFIHNFGTPELNYLTQKENEFLNKFAKFVHEENVDFLMTNLNKAYMDITRNGSAVMIFTELGIRVMQGIRPK